MVSRMSFNRIQQYIFSIDMVNLLKELDPLSSGWDGNYNGEKMPISDYWFKVKLQDGRTFTSHFTLKR